MERKLVYFRSIENVMDFINTTGNMQLIMKLINGSEIVDAKSLLGIFSLDLSKPVTLELRGDDSSMEAAWRTLSPYLKDPS